MALSLQYPLKFLQNLKKKPDLVGIDIGTYAFKIVLLRKTGDQYTVQEWAVVPYAEDIPIDTPLIDRRPQAVLALQNYLRSAPFKTRTAVTSISGNSVIVRYVKMAKMAPDELAKSLKFEAEPYIPFNIEEVNLSFHILGDIIEDGQPQSETVLVAAKKDAIDIRIDLLKEAGLNPVILDIDAFALENAYDLCFPQPQADTILFMNIGASSTNMSIIDKGISRVVRDVFIAGNTFTKAIQKQFQCDTKTAELKKITYGLIEEQQEAEGQQVIDALLPVARDLLIEVQRSIDFYLSQANDRTIHKIMLCGGSAQLKMLDQFLSRELKIPVEIFNPFTGLQDVSSNLTEEQKAILPQMAIAVGLALRQPGDSQA